ncbi:membrane protein [Pandoraea eparura]|uniref:Membrane protein n=1 Tax=Pandoraea eparura TaxID=2508291 RepID=A0A5E4RE38_9BURK|nr:diguanylate cyclase [Pandoraea eparura]VVD60279.1 membrane protein [Pandoraea eparura]
MAGYKLIKSLHARILLVICAAAFPLLIGSAYYLQRQTELLRNSTRLESTQFLRLAAGYTKSEISGTGETLAAISVSPAIHSRNWPLCNSYLNRLVTQRSDRYSNVGVIDLDGRVLCSGVHPGAGNFPNLGDRTYFRRALIHPGLAIGDYQQGRLTGLPSIAVSTALRDESGRPFAVVFASLRLGSLERMGAAPGDRDANITILDRNGTILVASDPLIGRVGEPLHNVQLRRAIMEQSQGVQLSTGSSGDFRLVGSTLAGSPDDPSAIIVLYTSRGSSVFASLRRDLWLGTLVAAALILLAVGAGWTGTNALIGRNIRRIANAAARLRERDFSTRVASEVSGSEFQLIAIQLDEMAKELDLRERDWQTSIDRQSHQVELLRRIAQTEPLNGILESICEFAEEQVPGSRASLLLVDDDHFVVSCVAPGLPEAFREGLIDARAVHSAGSCGTAIAEHRAVISEDIENDPLWANYRDLASAHNLRACWSYPVVSTGDRVSGSFALYFSEHRTPGSNELPVSQMAAELAAVAIDRHRTGEALSQSEAEYRSLFDTNPYPMWVSDKVTGRFLAVNDSAITQYGYPREALLGMQVSELDVSYGEAEEEDSVHSAHAPALHAKSVKLHRDARGGMLEVEVAYFPLVFKGRNATLALISDVTYRSKLTHTIQEQKALFSLLMDSTVEAIYGVDQNGLCTFANAACERLLGYSAAYMAGQSMHTLVHHRREDGSTYDPAACRIHNSIESGSHVHVDDEVFWKSDGSPMPVEYWAYPIVRDGKVNGSIVTFIDTTERRRQQEELRRRATYDGLTGLLNRSSFVLALESRLARADAHNRRPVVAILDLDGFKEINDSLGHAAGDNLLRDVAERLCNVIDSSGDVGRLGGDEFVFVLDEIDARSINTSVEAVLEAIRQPFSISGLDVQISGSIGAARFPGAGLDADTLLRSADAAMYAAKKDGHGFTLTERVDSGIPRPFLMSELRHALQKNEFVLYFQPKVSLQGQTRIGFEALLRWNHPELGMVGPGEFMPMIELSDLIHPLTDWVIDSAVSQFRAVVDTWPDAFIAVNVSMRNLIDQQFASRVRALLELHHFPMDRLKLEVTE